MGGNYVTRIESLRFWANYHPYFISKIWKNAVSSAIAFEKHPNLITIKFEELLLNTENVLQTICEHCQITFEPQMLLVPQVGSSSQKDNPDKLGVDEKRVGAWQRGGLNTAEIKICDQVTSNELQHFNYSLSGANQDILLKIWYLALLPVKATLAVLLNWNRTKGIVNFIKNRILK